MYFYVCMCVDTQYLPRKKGRKIKLKKSSNNEKLKLQKYCSSSWKTGETS